MAVEAAEQPPGASEYATKADLETGLERLERATKADLEAGLERVQQATKADLEAGLTGVQHAIELQAERMQTEMANLRADMAHWRADMVERHNALSRWVIGFIVAVIVMLAALGVFERIVPLFMP